MWRRAILLTCYYKIMVKLTVFFPEGKKAIVLQTGSMWKPVLPPKYMKINYTVLSQFGNKNWLNISKMGLASGLFTLWIMEITLLYSQVSVLNSLLQALGKVDLLCVSALFLDSLQKCIVRSKRCSVLCKACQGWKSMQINYQLI